MVQIEVAYAKPEHQTIIPLTLPEGSTVAEAIHQSGIVTLLSEFERQTLEERLGIFGERVFLSSLLKGGDRVEIYRSLIKDPKEARRERARQYASLMKLKKQSAKRRNDPSDFNSSSPHDHS